MPKEMVYKFLKRLPLYRPNLNSLELIIYSAWTGCLMLLDSPIYLAVLFNQAVDSPSVFAPTWTQNLLL